MSSASSLLDEQFAFLTDHDILLACGKPVCAVLVGLTCSDQRHPSTGCLLRCITSHLRSLSRAITVQVYSSWEGKTSSEWSPLVVHVSVDRAARMSEWRSWYEHGAVHTNASGVLVHPTCDQITIRKADGQPVIETTPAGHRWVHPDSEGCIPLST